MLPNSFMWVDLPPEIQPLARAYCELADYIERNTESGSKQYIDLLQLEASMNTLIKRPLSTAEEHPRGVWIDTKVDETTEFSH